MSETLLNSFANRHSQPASPLVSFEMNEPYLPPPAEAGAFGDAPFLVTPFTTTMGMRMWTVDRGIQAVESLQNSLLQSEQRCTVLNLELEQARAHHTDNGTEASKAQTGYRALLL